MSKPEETTPTTPPELSVVELSPEERFMRDALALGPRRQRKEVRKALRIEVTPQTFEAVKANPNELKLTAKDRHGNPVHERPAVGFTMHVVEGPIRESEVGPEEYKRIREESRGAGNPDPYTTSTAQTWTAQRTWNGEVRYRPDDGRSNPNVTHAYDIFDVLKEDDR